jgi:hypothetical protein
LPHFEVTAFLTAAIGLLSLISFCLLVFGRLGVGSIVAFLVPGIVIAQVRDVPATTVLALREFAELARVLTSSGVAAPLRRRGAYAQDGAQGHLSSEGLGGDPKHRGAIRPKPQCKLSRMSQLLTIYTNPRLQAILSVRLRP